MTEKTVEAGVWIRESIESATGAFNRALLLTTMAKWSAWWMIGAASCLIICKTIGEQLGFDLEYLLISYAPFLLLGLWDAHAHRYTRSDAAAWLDLKSAAGGIFMGVAQGMSPVLKPFSQKMPRINPIPTIRRLSIPALFLSTALVVPWSPRGEPASAASIENRADVAAQRVEQAFQHRALSEEKARQLRDNLSRFKRDALKSPEASVEAIDQVLKTLDREIVKKATAYQNLKQRASELAEAGSKEEVTAAAKSIEQLLQELGDNQHLPKELEALLKKLAGPDAKPENLVSGACANLSAADGETLKQLARLLQDHAVTQLSQIAQAQDALSSTEAKEHLEAMIAQAEADAQALETARELLGPPGASGTSRGRGDAPLLLGDETDTSTARFKPTPLSSKRPGIPGAGIGVKRRPGALDLPPTEFRGPVTSAAPSTGAQSGPDKYRALGPYHRQIAERYFEEKPK